MTACTLHIKWFPWHQEPKWPQWPQQPQQPCAVASMTSTASFHQKTFNLMKNTYFGWFVIFYYLKKAPKSQNNSKFIKEQEILTNWTIDGREMQHWFQSIKPRHISLMHRRVCVYSFSTPKGIRIPVTSVKGKCPRPLDDGGAYEKMLYEIVVQHFFPLL